MIALIALTVNTAILVNIRHQTRISREAGHKASVECVLNLKKVGIAARIWAEAHQGMFPRSFPEMAHQTGELAPTNLRCPSDPSRTPSRDWQQINALHISYELLSPGASDHNPQTVYCWCPIHKHALFADGSVQMDQAIEFKDGRFLVE